MKRYITAALSIMALYGLNRFCLIPAATGELHDLLAWHGADVLAGGLMLCILNAALLRAGRSPLRHWGKATLFLVGCGSFWEIITPLYLPRSVGDPWDLLAYWLGGSLMLWMDRRLEKKDFGRC